MLKLLSSVAFEIGGMYRLWCMIVWQKAYSTLLNWLGIDREGKERPRKQKKGYDSKLLGSVHLIWHLPAHCSLFTAQWSRISPAIEAATFEVRYGRLRNCSSKGSLHANFWAELSPFAENTLRIRSIVISYQSLVDYFLLWSNASCRFQFFDLGYFYAND